MNDFATILRLKPERYTIDPPEAYVPGDTAPADDAQSAQETFAPPPAEDTGAPGPLVTLPGSQLTARDQITAAAQMAFAVGRRQWKDRAEREGGVINGLLRAKPRSVQEQCDYAKQRAWVPRGMTAGWSRSSATCSTPWSACRWSR